MSLTIKGSTDARLQPGSQVTLSVDGDSANLVYRGDYAACAEARPAKGSELEFDAVTFLVLSTRLTRERGGLGRLEITLGDTSKSGLGVEDPVNPQTTKEIDYTIIEKPLETHPLFATIFRNTESTGNLLAIKKWEAIADEYLDKKIALKYPIVSDPTAADGDWADLPEICKTYAKKRLSGIESYMVQVPVVRLTTSRQTAQSDSEAGFRDIPPKFDSAAPAWLKTCDRSVQRQKRGAWEQTEEWTGFDELDPDLYPVESMRGKQKQARSPKSLVPSSKASRPAPLRFHRENHHASPSKKAAARR